MTRLTNHIRGNILSRLVAYRFDARATELQEKEYTFSEKVYEHMLQAEKIDRELLYSLPDQWVPSIGTLEARIRHDWRQLNLRNARRVPQFIKERSYQVHLMDELADEHFRLSGARDDYVRERSEASQMARIALESVSSVETLIKVWPEVEPFALAWIDVGVKKGLPLVPADVLNAKLGLPIPGSELHQ